MKTRALFVVIALVLSLGTTAFADTSDDMITKYYSNILDRDPESAGAIEWRAEIDRMVSLNLATLEVS